MPKGSKTCPECKENTGPRAYECPKCGHIFLKRKEKHKNKFRSKSNAPKLSQATLKPKGEKVKWSDLTRGDYIRVLGGGPFWQFADGLVESLGYSGEFEVNRIDKFGIHAYPIDNKNSGHCYIWMADEAISKIGIIRQSHQIEKITNPKITNVRMARR